MNKEQFLQELARKLHQLPPEEVERQCAYYEELLADMVEDGMREEDAVAKLGDISDIVRNILQDTPLPTLVKTRIRPKNGWTAAAVIVAILGAPLWVPLILALLLSVFCVTVAIWAVILAFFAVVLSLGIAGIAILYKGLFLFPLGANYTLFSVGAGLLLLGLGCLVFLAAEYASITLFRCGKWIYRTMKGLFIAKEAA